MTGMSRVEIIKGAARSLLRAIAAAALLLGSAPLAAQSVGGSPQGEVVATASGKVEGFVRNGVLEFRGIPYAAPVAGDARWSLPQPVAPWTGVLPAMHFGGACPQAARYGLTERSDEENCLTLNISVPHAASAHPRPVLLWIHGGAFVGGAASLYRLDRLARDADAVVVSINYRLGVFGFMAPPTAASGARRVLALEDQRLAMRWVKSNIAAFGGNPDNITLAGESAGAASVCMHLIAPEQTGGLFHRAIVQSAACSTPLRSLAEAEAFASKVAGEAGCTDPQTTLACLKAIEPQRLIAAGAKAAETDLRAFAPFTGNMTVPRATLDALQAGAFARVPVLNGFTRDEMRLYVGYDVQNGAAITPDSYPLAVRRIYGAKADQVLAAYPLKPGERAPETLGSLMSDFMPGLGITHCLMLESGRLLARFTPVYQWEYADRSAPVRGVSIPILPDPGFVLGAVHSGELNALFPGFSNTAAMTAPDLAQTSQALADVIVTTWAAFLRGNPTAQEWPAAGQPGAVMRFEPGAIRPFDAWAEYKCDFWRSAYPAYFGQEPPSAIAGRKGK
ncbi:carboxylesterase family protein [Novosphingobium sp.]|uniref:carboxylesterase/lipase family protein n=1 Tax=Novosphingobium sp. TaxID=1874826 RepID=UPI00261DD9E6|nr:carboxylesterase family protein [Novosphingobium sp.]